MENAANVPVLTASDVDRVLAAFDDGFCVPEPGARSETIADDSSCLELLVARTYRHGRATRADWERAIEIYARSDHSRSLF